jgi:hypothetical protein
MLAEWRMVTRDRDNRVRRAVAAGASKYRVNQLTGIGRSTIDRILAATAPGGTINGPPAGRDDHRPESGAPRRQHKAPGQSGGGSGI